MPDDQETEKKPKEKAEKSGPHLYLEGRFVRVTLGSLQRVHFIGRSRHVVEPGEIVHMKMKNEITYTGTVEECVKADGEVCISFINDDLAPLKTE